MYTINADKLAQVVKLANVTEEKAMEYIDYDWGNGSEHQGWLDNAPAGEIASWLQSCIDEANAPIVECESCAEGGDHGVPSVGHSKNPDWSGYDLCQECIDEYDQRDPIGSRDED